MRIIRIAAVKLKRNPHAKTLWWREGRAYWRGTFGSRWFLRRVSMGSASCLSSLGSLLWTTSAGRPPD
eukprot:scaffold504914_cov27-Prasinocladus_malaysianus.AAC.1